MYEGLLYDSDRQKALLTRAAWHETLLTLPGNATFLITSLSTYSAGGRLGVTTDSDA